MDNYDVNKICDELGRMADAFERIASALEKGN